VIKDPFGGPVPEGLQKALLSSVPSSIKIERQFVGSGRRETDPLAVIRAAVVDISHAAVKFTWSGDQNKTVPSVLFSPATPITSEMIAPHVTTEARFANDFIVINCYEVSAVLMAALLTRLDPELQSGPQDRTGPVTISIISGVGTDAAFSYSGSMVRARVASVMRDVARQPDTDAGLLEAFHYLALNMGDVSAIRESPNP